MDNQNKYTNGKIYKILSAEYPDKFYVGSTVRTLHRRWIIHKKDSKGVGRDTLFYRTLNEIGFDQFSINLIENHPCETRSQLLQREAFWIELLKPTLNTAKPWVSEAEKKLKQRKRDAKYRANNKDKIKVKDAKYRANNKDKIKVKDAKYRANNKDKIKVKDAKYRANNKEKEAQKCDCNLCGRTVRRRDIRRHQKTTVCKLQAYVDIEFISDNEVEIEFIG